MKFSYKILIWSIVVMGVVFGGGGYIFVNSVFQTSMEREIGQAMNESSILQFAFETAALNIPSKYDVLQNKTIEEIGVNLEKSGQDAAGRLLRLSNEDRTVLYASAGFTEDIGLLMQIDAQTKIYQVTEKEGHYYIQTGTTIHALNRILYLETMKDITEIYEERAKIFQVYRRLTIIMLLLGSVVMFFISSWLTRPIRLLTRATRKMAEGDYDYRARLVSNDEMGQLTKDFNKMANTLEDNIHKLEDEIRAREDFIAAFSHELKTPLTAIIGYADMLRSRKLDEETHFLSANYIYTEGKRLENMSLRLLDIIVTKRYETELQNVNVEELFGYLRDMYREKENVDLRFGFDAGSVSAESNLIKSVLLNLVDNAYKASTPPEGENIIIEVYGKREEQGYLFAVKDYGMGIPKEELKKITEAFYMVDKSRSRSKNGAGLGLALCREILNLHDSELIIESTEGEGSSFSFRLPYGDSPREVNVDGA
ncbi:MAG: HAMP domain-containing histidine kinase [Bacteroidales bacterium]|nr:HAMP domain-containing histidine kinase [Lachnoclostridium sp.]MCM1384618.1 HAMP domain-containing histidine kinase [Lachnoclostridium sp.]MCM1463843.1 HAMP domain-containing histidine kinase [Bacteroidales bacterium]